MKRCMLTVIFVLWIVLILFLSFQNGSDTAYTSMIFTSNILRFFIRREPEHEMLIYWDGVFRLAAHFVLMFFFGIIGLAVVRQWVSRLRAAVAITMLAGFGLGVISETGKLLIEGRHCDFFEMGLNVMGAVTGTVILAIVYCIINGNGGIRYSVHNH